MVHVSRDRFGSKASVGRHRACSFSKKQREREEPNRKHLAEGVARRRMVGFGPRGERYKAALVTSLLRYVTSDAGL